MLLSRSCVAESFITTPRAPSCKASTICFFSAAAVNKITRTAFEFEPELISLNASNPGMRGIAKSSNRMSGLSCRASFTNRWPRLILAAQSHPYLTCSAMLTDVYQAFLHNARQFAAHLPRHVDFIQIGMEPRRNSRLPLKPFDCVGKEP